MNGEDKGDSGVETQNSEGNADDESDPLGPNCYYDKSKSFFDNISCDDTRSVRGPHYPPAPHSHTCTHCGRLYTTSCFSFSCRKANDKSGGSGFPRLVAPLDMWCDEDNDVCGKYWPVLWYLKEPLSFSSLVFCSLMVVMMMVVVALYAH